MSVCHGRAKFARKASAQATSRRSRLWSMCGRYIVSIRVGSTCLCPVLAYYGAGRAWLPSNQRIPSEPNPMVQHADGRRSMIVLTSESDLQNCVNGFIAKRQRPAIVADGCGPDLKQCAVPSYDVCQMPMTFGLTQIVNRSCSRSKKRTAFRQFECWPANDAGTNSGPRHQSSHAKRISASAR